MIIRRKGKLMLLIVLAMVVVLFLISLTRGVVLKVPAFVGFRSESICIYDGDDGGEKLEVKKKMKIESTKTMEDKVNVVVNELQKRFSGIDLEVVGYDDVSGKKILMLDLRDKDVSVERYLDAGSTESRINLGVLVNSLLQNGRKVSNWVDGVKILVNGEESVETSHVNLNEVFYRTSDKVYLQ